MFLSQGVVREQIIVDWILDSAKRGFPIDKQSLLYSVEKIIESMPPSEKEQIPFKIPGRTWYYSFLQRHRSVVEKKSEYLSISRSNLSEQSIRKWFLEVQQELIDADITAVLEDPQQIFNVDETRFHLNPNSNSFVLAQKGKPVYKVSKNDKENLTISITVSAAGEVAPPLVLYKYKRVPTYFGRIMSSGWGVGGTENGWMTSAAFYEYVSNVFLPYLHKQNIAFPVIIFMDGHSSYMSLPLSKFCKENKIILVAFYPNATHILQPLDVAYFKPIKQYWKTEVKKYQLENRRDITKEDVPIIINKILKSYDLSEAIRNGFKSCGLYPFNPDNVNYGKIVNTSTESYGQKESSIDATSRNPTFTQHLESQLPPLILQQFKESTISMWK